MSIRNNEERAKHLMNQDPPPQVLQESAAPPQQGGLNFVIPTELIDLPSRGGFYAEDHPLHNEKTIEIRHMTAKEEEILTSRTLLKKGVAIDRVIKNVIIDKRINVDSLLVGDKNAVLVYSRIFAYGPEYATKVTCPACAVPSEFTFNLLEHQLSHPDDFEVPEAEGFKAAEDGKFIIYLPRTKAVVEVRLLTGKDEAQLIKATEMRKKKRLPNAEVGLVDQMLQFVVSINGVTTKFDLKRFLESIPAGDSRYLRSIYQKLSPNLDLSQEFDCVECGQTTFMEVPFTPEFFWPRQ
jgi:hypothetical protein